MKNMMYKDIMIPVPALTRTIQISGHHIPIYWVWCLALLHMRANAIPTDYIIHNIMNINYIITYNIHYVNIHIYLLHNNKINFICIKAIICWWRRR